MKKALVVGLAVLALAACDKKGGDTTTTSSSATPAAKEGTGGGACLHEDTSMCIQYPALSATEQTSEKADCEKDKAKWMATCPTANLLGTCTNAKKGGGLAMKLYKGKAFESAAEAKKAMCSDSGDVFAPN